MAAEECGVLNLSPIPFFASSSRRRVHRAFLRWYAGNLLRFRHPLTFIRRTDDCLDFRFDGICEAVSGSLHNGGMDIHVDWQGDCLGAIWRLDVLPEPGRGGVHCRACEPAERVAYPTREALWIAHEFEPFLDWVNHTLSEARWLGMRVDSNRFSAAGVFRTPVQVEKEFGEDAFWIPLQTSSREQSQ